MDVKQHRPGRVGAIRHMGGTSGEVPDQPAVHRAAAKLPLLCPLPGTRDIVQQPLELGTGEIGINQQPRFLLYSLYPAISLQLIADGSGAAALPDDGVAHRLTGCSVPQNGGLPLVGDAEGRDALGIN